jgi:hypothetical protein
LTNTGMRYRTFTKRWGHIQTVIAIGLRPSGCCRS